MKKVLAIFTITLTSFFQINAQNNSLYFVFLNNNPEKEIITDSKAESLQAAHLKNIDRLADEGKLIAAGPFEGGGGMFVLNAKDQFQAWSYLETDPAVKANRFKVEILPFSLWNGKLQKAGKPYEMKTYQFIRLVSNPDFKGDEDKLIHDNRIFMSKMMKNNPEVLAYGFFSEFNDGMLVVDGSAELAESLIKEHASVKAGQLSFEIKLLYIAKGTFGD
jgi:uncharacterized protein YciI